MSNTELQKETAIQNEQQLKTKQKIANDIIKILAANNLSISDGKEILYTTSKQLGDQLITDTTAGLVDASILKRELSPNYLCDAHNCTFSTEYPKYIKQGMTIG